MRRAALGVIAGYVVWTGLWLGGGHVLSRVYPDEAAAFGDGHAITAAGYLAAALVLSAVCSFVAGLLASRTAPEGAMRTVLVMALLLLATGIFVQRSVWDRMPVWYHLTFLALIVPVCLAGGRTQQT